MTPHAPESDVKNFGDMMTAPGPKQSSVMAAAPSNLSFDQKRERPLVALRKPQVGSLDHYGLG